MKQLIGPDYPSFAAMPRRTAKDVLPCALDTRTHPYEKKKNYIYIFYFFIFFIKNLYFYFKTIFQFNHKIVK